MYKNIFKYDDMKRSEHMAVRNAVGWYFWTHQLLEITGPDVTAFLDYIFPNNIASLAVGRDRYTTMLNEQGEIIDDVVVMRMEENRYWVSTLYATKTDDWWYFHQGDYDVDWTEITDEWAMYAVQGPKSPQIIEELTGESVADLKFFAHREAKIGGIPCLINRGGYSGEKFGYEIYINPEQGEALEALLDPAVQRAGGKEVTEFQVMAWTLPTEANFYYMRDLAHTNPFEMRLEKCDTVFLLDYPVELCLASVEARIGQKREDMPWVEEEFDEEFRQWILDFPNTQLPLIHEKLKQYAKNRNIIVFRTRGEAKQYLDDLENFSGQVHVIG